MLDASTETVQTQEVWQKNVTGENIDVAVLDTGIENNTELNVERQVTYAGNNAEDYNGHGTHVAGIVASPDEQYRGVAYGADLYDVKVLDSSGTGSSSDIISGLEWAVENGAEVATLSLGAQVETCDGTSAISEAVNNAVQQGVVVTVAAGNAGPENGTITAPGCAERALTVGSSSNGEISDFSSRGPTADGRTKPDVVAPGEGITSTYIGSQEFETLSGTSMATPHVAGAAALLLAANPDMTPTEVKNITEHTATDLGYGENAQGSGQLDVYAAYQATTESNQTNSSENRRPSISVVGSTVNTTGEITAELKVNVSDADNSSLNTSFYMEGEIKSETTGYGVMTYTATNLSANTTYNWSAETTDGINTSRTPVQSFSTELQEDSNQTENVTGPLPPGIRKKEEKPPAFLRGLPAFLRPAFDFPGNFFQGIQNGITGKNNSNDKANNKKPEQAQKAQKNKPENPSGEKSQKPEEKGEKPQQAANKSQKPEEKPGKKRNSSEMKPEKGNKPSKAGNATEGNKPETGKRNQTEKKQGSGKEKGAEAKAEADASVETGNGKASAQAKGKASTEEKSGKEKGPGKRSLGKAKGFLTGNWFAGFLG